MRTTTRQYDFEHIEAVINSCDDMLDFFEDLHTFDIKKESDGRGVEWYTVTLYNGMYGSGCSEWMKLDVRNYATTAYRNWNDYSWEPLNVDSYELFDTVAELFHGVKVRGYLERSCRGLMESEEVNDESEAFDLVWEWLSKGLFVEVITDEDRTLYSPENFRDSTDWRDNVIEHEFRENVVV